MIMPNFTWFTSSRSLTNNLRPAWWQNNKTLIFHIYLVRNFKTVKLKKKKKTPQSHYITFYKFTSIAVWVALTKRQFILIIGHSMHQGDGATRIGCSLLQEVNARASWNLACLLSSERLMLKHTHSHSYLYEDIVLIFY